MTDIVPFQIAVPDAVLDDLRHRLTNTRWPEAECVDDWSQGIPLGYARDLAAYWADGYDWRAREAALNRFDQYVTEIDGLVIHFIHQRSPHPEALPLIITHGWPGSIPASPLPEPRGACRRMRTACPSPIAASTWWSARGCSTRSTTYPARWL